MFGLALPLHVVLVILLVNILSAYGDVCIPTQHRIFTEQDLESSFKKKSLTIPNAFHSVAIDDNTNKVFAGGKNTIGVYEGSTLNKIEQTSWTVDNSQCLNDAQISKDLCHNYVTLLDFYKGEVVACATGATRPVYRVFNKTGLNVTRKGTYRACASPNPEHRIVGKVTSLGEMIAGTYSDGAGKGAEVLGSYMAEKLAVYREKLRTLDKDINSGAEFVKSFYLGDRIYKFFMESAEEISNTEVATIGRFCQTDNGAPSFLSNAMWTTFRKTRLSCHFDRPHSRIDFKYLVDVEYDAKQKLFFALYTMTKHESLASGICTYSLAEIEDAFSSNFLEKDSNTKEWKQIANRNVFDGCKVNNTTLKDNPDRTSPGKEPTNSLSFENSMFLSSHRIMAKRISPRTEIFQYMKSVTRFSRIAIDESFSNDNQTLLNIIDDNGRILVLSVQLRSEEKTCIIEEINTGLKEPKFFQLNPIERLQYITTQAGNNLMVFDIDSCIRYQSQSECVTAHNPRCGWSNNASKCLSFMKRGNETLIQDLNKCPKRKDIFSAWSAWLPQAQEESDKKYCLARHRQCHSCDVKLCDTATVEVVNCTVNEVEDVGRWMKEGSTNGVWSPWNHWSECGYNLKCGNDTKIRYRECASPKPANGGRDCLGNDFECATCPKKEDIVNILWGQWSTWGSCQQKGESRYEQSRSRLCSKPEQCPKGSPKDTRKCAPNGVIWGDWTNCSCQQKVRHRYPVFIHSCQDCPRLRQPQYDPCVPTGCPSPPVVIEDDKNATAHKNDTDSASINGTITPTDGGVVDVDPITPNPIPITRGCVCKDGYTFQLGELLGIGVGIIASCFLIIIAVVLLILRRKKNYCPNPKLKKANSIPLLDEEC